MEEVVRYGEKVKSKRNPFCRLSPLLLKVPLAPLTRGDIKCPTTNEAAYATFAIWLVGWNDLVIRVTHLNLTYSCDCRIATILGTKKYGVGMRPAASSQRYKVRGTTMWKQQHDAPFLLPAQLHTR